MDDTLTLASWIGSALLFLFCLIFGPRKHTQELERPERQRRSQASASRARSDFSVEGRSRCRKHP